jgi:type IX secretion system PorP/SprF family membrane protein
VKRIFQSILILIIVGKLMAQDAQFSQFYAAPLYLGPSMAGSNNAPRLCLNFRDQWPNLRGKFITTAISYDDYFSTLKSGVGLLFVYDNAGGGKQTTMQVGLNYSYRIKVNNYITVQPGLQFQYFKKDVNFGKLVFADQFYGEQILSSSVETMPDPLSGHFDFSTSVIGFTKNIWFGATVDHLLKLNSTLAANEKYVPLRISAYGGIRLRINEKLISRTEQNITLALHYWNQSYIQQLDFGVYYSKNPFTIGLWYRGIPIIKSSSTFDAIIVSGGLMVKKILFTYSYDFTVSSLITTTGGSHELAFIYTFETNKKIKQRMGAVPCPKF